MGRRPPNAGFSDAAPDRLYLPLDPDPDRPTVAAQLADEDSLLHLVRRLIALRAAHPALGAGSDGEVLHRATRSPTFAAGILVVVNPRGEPAFVDVPKLVDREIKQLDGNRSSNRPKDESSTDAFGWGIFTLG